MRHLGWRLPALLSLPFLLAPIPSRAANDDPGAAKKPFTIEDLFRLKGVADPAVSPDGSTIAYAVVTSDFKTKKRASNLWRMDADGKNARRLTLSEARDEHPAFSPDGKALAFVSDRSGEAQLWLLPTSGGEPEKKTDVPGGIEGPLFSPDGARVAFAADVHPGCGADAACNKKRDDEREKSKLKAHVADRLLFRHWNEWKDGKRKHILVLELATGAIRDLTPGDFDAPVFSTGGPLAYDFSPDGTELAFTSNHDPDEALSTNADVFTVPVAGDEAALKSPRNLTKGNSAWDGTPRYSPDGRSIAYRRQAMPRYESDRFRLALLDRATGGTRDLLPSLDAWVTDLSYSEGGKKILFEVSAKARTPLHELDVATGAIRVVTDVGTLDSFAADRGGAFAVASRRRIGSPSEIHRFDLRGAVPSAGSRLTFHNADVEMEVDIRPAEEISVPGASGKPVHVWIVKPHGFDPAKKYPLILNIHGGPQQAWSDAFRGDWQVYPGAGYVVAFPNPHGTAGFGQEYTAAISGDFTGKVMEDIEKVTAAVAKLPYVDASRMGAMGWSWGGYAMMWLEGHPHPFKALATMMGVYDLRAMHSATEEVWWPEWDVKGAPWNHAEHYRKESPSEFVKAFKTPCLVITGEKDFRVPYTQSLEFFTDLQLMKVPSRLIVFEKAGHWPAWYEMALYYAAHLDWFHRYLGGPPAPWDPLEMAAGR